MIGDSTNTAFQKKAVMLTTCYMTLKWLWKKCTCKYNVLVFTSHSTMSTSHRTIVTDHNFAKNGYLAGSLFARLQLDSFWFCCTLVLQRMFPCCTFAFVLHRIKAIESITPAKHAFTVSLYIKIALHNRTKQCKTEEYLYSAMELQGNLCSKYWTSVLKILYSVLHLLLFWSLFQVYLVNMRSWTRFATSCLVLQKAHLLDVDNVKMSKRQT